jgi:hypothetical protein
MSETGAAHRLVHSANFHLRVVSEHRGVVALDHDKSQSVVERELGYLVFELGNVLGLGQWGTENDERQDRKTGQH